MDPDDLTTAAIGIGFIVLAFAVSAFLTWTVGRHQCEAQAAMMQVEYNYTFMTGCMVKINGRWVPMSNLRAVN